MSEVQSPTDTGADQDSSDIRDESLLEQNQQDQSADYDEGTDSSEEQDSHSEESQDNTSNNETSEYDEKLAKFAKSQGIEDLSEATDREKSLLKVAYDNRVAARSKKPQGEVKDAVEKLYSGDANRLNRLEARLATQDFFSRTEGAREFEPEMIKLILQEQETYGEDAAKHLASNLPRLLQLAKLEAGAYDSDAARESGRRDEREKLRKRQEGSANGGNASSSINNSKSKLTRESIDAMSEDEYAERREEIDAAISRGELY